ncbi:cryptochrome/photolyase family protein [Halobellus clavatus]|jgi:deoxyribodipyrimidine photo-lyase|uniref:Deoxyribodipyrimidine photo-lyase n=1 Tax=Halobellus clavatus TaxID=660517 RepID=A0A1H3IKR2_9EURY|nr:deoxyribodipyrimidine photo-lyase [Halobellus clavatus]SDY27879.1 deoxyribodipyrimidine photo-lyase [Halobellus clavatus]
MQLHWHRRDLRAADNRGLAMAADAAGGDRERDGGAADGDAASGPVVPVFVFDDAVLDHAGAPRVRYMLDALSTLRAWYRDRGSDLLVARGDPADILPDLAVEYDAERVVWNKDYSGLARERDARVRRALNERDIARASVHDAIFHKPGSITTNDGDPYSVFTYFWKKWRDRPKPDPFAAPEEEALAAVEGDALPSIEELGFEAPGADVQPAGTAAARERLADFCADGIFRYEEDRDYPTRNAVSHLSTDLKFGTIGIREVYEATADALERADDEAARESVEEYQSQLAWREFYTHVLFFNPEVVSENFREYEHEIDWRDDAEELAAWKAGETGYPIVDAGMRQLKDEAYMHNRVRMIVASFLTKDLQIDWREGYAHFREYLADHDTANDNGGWQWAASTGTDAQPYFRIFNPMTQGERYDPDAEYIKEYVPELRGVEADLIHEWHELSPTQRASIETEYPEPIVDHSERREAALAMFEAARGDD